MYRIKAYAENWSMANVCLVIIFIVTLVKIKREKNDENNFLSYHDRSIDWASEPNALIW